MTFVCYIFFCYSWKNVDVHRKAKAAITLLFSFNKENLNMKVNKTQAALYIFHKLLKNKRITKEEIQSELEISHLTFLRYIQELRTFVDNFFLAYEIRYSREDEAYYLIVK